MLSKGDKRQLRPHAIYSISPLEKTKQNKNYHRNELVPFHRQQLGLLL